MQVLAQPLATEIRVGIFKMNNDMRLVLVANIGGQWDRNEVALWHSIGCQLE